MFLALGLASEDPRHSFHKGEERVMNQPDLFRTVRLGSWGDTRDTLRQFPVSWIFRGQCDSAYSLITSVQRLPPVVSGEGELGAAALPLLEHTILSTFKGQARNGCAT